MGEPATGKCDNDDMKFPDPWEGVPADRRLDFTVIREPIESLAEATILGVERALPVALQAVPGSLAVLLMLAKLVETTFSTIRYICAEKPEDPARRISFATSTPPLLRSMLDAIYTLIFIGEDPPTRFKWYYNAGWRELREEYDRHVQRYSGKTEWKAWLAGYGTHLATLEGQWVTAHEAANPKAIRRWPTPSNMSAPLASRISTVCSTRRSAAACSPASLASVDASASVRAAAAARAPSSCMVGTI